MNSNNLELASIPKRFLAFFIDELIITFLVYFIFWDTLMSSSYDPEQLTIALTNLILPVFFIKFIYQTFFVWYYGATLGKLALKIKVIDYYSFRKVTFFSSVLRSISRIASEYFIYLGFFVAFFTEGKQTFHDKIGRTLVVNA